MKYLILFLITSNALADVGFVKESDIGKENGVTVYYDGKCPGKCYPLEPGNDVSLLKPSGNKLVPDAAKIAAKILKEAQEEQAKADKEAAIQSAKAALKSATTVEELREVLKTLLDAK